MQTEAFLQCVTPWLTNFFPHKLFTAKNKKGTPKENQCTVCWLLNGVLYPKMFNLHTSSRHAFQAKMLRSRVRKIYFLASIFHQTPRFPPEPAFSSTPHVFHYTLCFPLHTMFSNTPCAGSEIALSWSPMQLKILHWRPEFRNWSPAGD